MKNSLIIYFLFFGITTFVNAQDTIIEHENFTLQIQKVTEKTTPYQYVRTGKKFEVLEYEWTNVDIRGILKDWMGFMELETIEYRIDDSVASRMDFLQLIDMDEFLRDSKIDTNYVKQVFRDRDVASIFMGYNVVYKQKVVEHKAVKDINKQAFMIFCEVMNLEVEIVPELTTYWKLEIVDMTNAAISYDQNMHWKRTDLDEYVYYERIKYRRIADLLSRKLDTFVRPIPYNAQKFDVRMPYSDDVFDLKYSMIEHGLELTEVTEKVDVMVVREKE